MKQDDARGGTVILTFESSHHALWAEDLARERDLTVEVVPAPPHATGACGLALSLSRDEARTLESLCTAEGITVVRTDST